MDEWRKTLILVLLELIVLRARVVIFVMLAHNHQRQLRNNRRRRAIRYSLLSKMGDINAHMDKLTGLSDVHCLSQLQMDRYCFDKLCWLLKEVGGLRDEKFVTLREQVSLFLRILGHHTTNRTIGLYWQWSGQTVSRYFRKVLDALLKCNQLILVTPTPVSEQNDNDEEPWKCFQGCFGALDGTLIDVTVPVVEHARYRSRKDRVSVNVLGVCDTKMRFVYVLCGWEGSAADGRVLRDAVYRPAPNGLQVPLGNYYLVDAEYANCDGFLAPYRGRRYHLKEWEEGRAAPQDHEEFFNMKHSRARSIIERAFGRFKNRWKILKRPSEYPLNIQNRIIMPCALLHNFIKRKMPTDPFDSSSSDSDSDDDAPEEFVDGLQNSPAWNNFRDALAINMWEKWRATRH